MGAGVWRLAWPLMVLACPVKSHVGFWQQGLAKSVTRRHAAGRLGNRGHLPGTYTQCLHHEVWVGVIYLLKCYC